MKIAVLSALAASLVNFRGPLLVEMVRRGHEVLAFAPDHDAQTRSWLTAQGITPVDYKLARAGMNPLRDLASILEIRRLLRRHRPDMALGYYIKPVIYGALGAALAGIRPFHAMIEGLGFAFTESPGDGFRRRGVRQIAALLYRRALARATRVVFLNPDDRQEFVQRGLVDPDKTRLLGGIGVDLDDWPGTPLPAGPVTFLLVARLLVDKGVRDYVQAARLLRPQHPDVRFLLLGGLDDNPSAIRRSEVEGWVAEGLVEWPGHVPVQPWLAQAHVYVLPSYREGVPRSTQEAMAFGRPVITTDVPGCRETVVEGVNGHLVPPRDPAALAAAMQRLLNAPDRIAAMGRESRRLAEERFDVHEQNRKLLAFMEL